MPMHVARFARALKTVHHDDGQGLAAVRLPMTMAQDLHSGRDLDEAVPRASAGLLFEVRKNPASVLQMPATEESSRFEDWTVASGLRDSHKLILNNVEPHFASLTGGTPIYADFRVRLPECEHAFEALVYGEQKRSAPGVRAKS